MPLSDCPVSVYYRGAVPPFPIIKGPIAPNAASRSFALSDTPSGKISLALSDIDKPTWLLPGQCWSIESDCEEPWVGFIAPGEIAMDETTIRISLDHPLLALLSVETTPSLSARGNVGNLVQQAVLAAQAQANTGITLGSITETPVIEAGVRGDTVASLIDLLADEAKVDYRIRAVRQGPEMSLFLDFGVLRRPRDITLLRGDIVEGRLRMNPLTSSVSSYGSASSFTDREVSTVLGTAARKGTGQVDQSRRPEAGGVTAQFMADRDIGPAAGRHQSVVSERQVVQTPEVASRNLHRFLEAVDEVYITTEQARIADLQVGDVIALNVPDWIPGWPVMGDFQVRLLEPQEATGERDMMLWRQFRG
jgi:hypothetical protein